MRNESSQDPEVRRGLFGLGLLILWHHKTYASSKRWQKRTKVKGSQWDVHTYFVFTPTVICYGIV